MGSAALVTVPLLGYVAGLWTGNAPIPVAPGPTTAGAPMLTGPHAFVPSLASRPGDSHHQRATATPDPGDGTVYQDDFLKWLDATFPGHKNSDREPLFISLDGEPDGWEERSTLRCGEASILSDRTHRENGSTRRSSYRSRT